MTFLGFVFVPLLADRCWLIIIDHRNVIYFYLYPMHAIKYRSTSLERNGMINYIGGTLDTRVVSNNEKRKKCSTVNQRISWRKQYWECYRETIWGINTLNPGSKFMRDLLILIKVNFPMLSRRCYPNIRGRERGLFIMDSMVENMQKVELISMGGMDQNN